MYPPMIVIAKYVLAKKRKGTWRTPKPEPWNGRTVLTGVCPCDCHRDNAMIVCDAEYGDCECCSEVCS